MSHKIPIQLALLKLQKDFLTGCQSRKQALLDYQLPDRFIEWTFHIEVMLSYHANVTPEKNYSIHFACISRSGLFLVRE